MRTALCKSVLMNGLIVFLDQKNKTKLVPAFILLCMIFMKKMKSSLQNGILITLIIFMNFNKTNEPVYILLLQRIVEKSSQKNLKVTINTLPNKLGHPESLKKKTLQLMCT